MPEPRPHFFRVYWPQLTSVVLIVFTAGGLYVQFNNMAQADEGHVKRMDRLNADRILLAADLQEDIEANEEAIEALERDKVLRENQIGNIGKDLERIQNQQDNLDQNQERTIMLLQQLQQQLIRNGSSTFPTQ